MIAQLDKEYLRIAKNRIYSRLLSYFLFEGRPLTTKGRWINVLVFLNYHIFSRIPAPRKVVKPIFILGMGRSGSTILGKILSIHKSVGFLNEPKAFWYFLHNEDDLIGSYSKSNDGRYNFSEKDITPQIISRGKNLYGWYLFFSGNKRVVDKYPEHLFRIPYIKKIFPDAKFILLTRDGRANSLSISSWSQRKGTSKSSEKHDWWGRDDIKWNYLVHQLAPAHDFLKEKRKELINNNNQVERGQIEWLVTMIKILEVKNDESCFLLRYEDFVSNPNTNINKLFNFCDLNSDKKVIEYCNTGLKISQTEKLSTLPLMIKSDFEEVLKKLNY